MYVTELLLDGWIDWNEFFVCVRSDAPDDLDSQINPADDAAVNMCYWYNYMYCFKALYTFLSERSRGHKRGQKLVLSTLK